VQLRPFIANDFRSRDESRFYPTPKNPFMTVSYQFRIEFKVLNSISSRKKWHYFHTCCCLFNQSRRLWKSHLGI